MVKKERKPISVADIVNGVGSDNIVLQNLDHCLIGINKTKDGSKVTFGTQMIDPSFALNCEQQEKIGLILWLPRKKVREIVNG
jgi:hypothetical protein